MMRDIEAIIILKNLGKVLDDYCELNDECKTAFGVAIEALERRSGEWIGYNAEDPNWLRTDGSPVFLQCSKCHALVVNNFSSEWNFCPVCGSRNTACNELKNKV